MTHDHSYILWHRSRRANLNTKTKSMVLGSCITAVLLCNYPKTCPHGMTCGKISAPIPMATRGSVTCSRDNHTCTVTRKIGLSRVRTDTRCLSLHAKKINAQKVRPPPPPCASTTKFRNTTITNAWLVPDLLPCPICKAKNLKLLHMNLQRPRANHASNGGFFSVFRAFPLDFGNSKIQQWNWATAGPHNATKIHTVTSLPMGPRTEAKLLRSTQNKPSFSLKGCFFFWLRPR